MPFLEEVTLLSQLPSGRHSERTHSLDTAGSWGAHGSLLHKEKVEGLAWEKREGDHLCPVLGESQAG